VIRRSAPTTGFRRADRQPARELGGRHLQAADQGSPRHPVKGVRTSPAFDVRLLQKTSGRGFWIGLMTTSSRRTDTHWCRRLCRRRVQTRSWVVTQRSSMAGELSEERTHDWSSTGWSWTVRTSGQALQRFEGFREREVTPAHRRLRREQAAPRSVVAMHRNSGEDLTRARRAAEALPGCRGSLMKTSGRRFTSLCDLPTARTRRSPKSTSRWLQPRRWISHQRVKRGV